MGDALERHLVTEVESGKVRGFIDTSPISQHAWTGKRGNERPVSRWCGIPFANVKRWEHSIGKSPVLWQDIRECYQFGPRVPQPASGIYNFMSAAFPNTELSELGYDNPMVQDHETECLNLNIYAPTSALSAAKGKLPVMVWLYGGSWRNGAASLALYNAVDFVRKSEEEGNPVIFVTANYRTGLYGFMASHDLEAEDPQGLTGNYGVRDVICLLQWVQRNIASFGGDRKQVTLFGESAGSNTAAMCCMWPGDSLFQHVILMSSAAGTGEWQTLEKHDEEWNDWLKREGIQETSVKARVAAAQRVPAQDLNFIGSRPRPGEPIVGIAPERGPNAVWTEAPWKMMMEGKINSGIKSIIYGLNKDEGSMFSHGGKLYTEQGWAGLKKTLPEQVRPLLEKLYPLHPNVDQSEGAKSVIDHPATRLITDSYFVAPALTEARALAKMSARNKPGADGNGPVPRPKIYVYQFEAVGDNDVSALLGARHAAEIGLVFRNRIWIPYVGDAATSDQMGRRWAQFAHSGQPGDDWPEYTLNEQGGGQQFVFQNGGQVHSFDDTDYKRAEIDFWTKVELVPKYGKPEVAS